jgi:leucine dehydrogenase
VAAQFGYYITAEDMNNTVEDTRQMLAANRYTACTPEDVGGSGNPSPVTAEGVVHAMRAAVLRVLGKGSLFGLRINVQGVGNVGLHLVRLLVRDGALIRACDKNAQAMDQVKAEFPEVEIVSPDKIFDLPGDIFAPCARGAVLNPETIARLKVKMVCGAANNTLAEEDRDGQSLAARGIVDCVDYNCNRGGVINAAQELVCRNPERVRQRVAKAYGDTLTILEEAERKGLAPYVVANALADSRAAEDHPLEGYIGEIHIARYVAMRKSREKKAA